MIPFIDSTVGIISSIVLFVSFILLQTKKISSTGKIYNGMNLGGSIGLLLYAINTNSSPFILLNAFWALAALYFIVRKK